MSGFKPQLNKPKDGFGPGQFVALFSCPGVHTFTHFGRKTDCRYGVMPSGATAFLCTRGHMLPFLFTFIIYRPSSDLRSPRRKAAVIPALPGACALWAVRARCAGCDCVHPQRQRVSLISVNGPRLGLRRARQALHNRAQCAASHFWIEVRLFDPRDYELLLLAHASA